MFILQKPLGLRTLSVLCVLMFTVNLKYIYNMDWYKTKIKQIKSIQVIILVIFYHTLQTPYKH